MWSRGDATLGDRTARTQWCPFGLEDENQGDVTVGDRMLGSWGDATLGCRTEGSWVMPPMEPG